MSYSKTIANQFLNIFGLLTTTGILFTNPVQAASINLGDWTQIGDVNVNSTGNQANISTGNNSVAAAGQIERDLGLNPGAFNDPNEPFFGAATEGSAITTNLNVQKGDRISFDWNFLTNDMFDDYAFFVADGVVTQLASVSDASMNSSSSFNSETGTATFNYTFANAGNYQVGIGVVDIGDVNGTSALQISNAQTEPVPDPLTILGTVVAGGFGISFRRKRCKK